MVCCVRFLNAKFKTLLSVRELLDLQITEADVICDIETPADTSEFDALDRDTSSEELLATPQEASQFMYITGIAFAFLVFIFYPMLMDFMSIIKKVIIDSGILAL
ncbi:hypothetical protein RR46_00458 [Papilio xuthus]|uniref:Uncharacterized protein n=1 Tax=Papilio xuthus TaxID=66420 RepID=A0A0N0PAF3_PAPXU|nr:hypothetical protein RR46_00458 [Papilio xuthus]